jgi:hypothetical protein
LKNTFRNQKLLSSINDELYEKKEFSNLKK